MKGELVESVVSAAREMGSEIAYTPLEAISPKGSM